MDSITVSHASTQGGIAAKFTEIDGTIATLPIAKQKDPQEEVNKGGTGTLFNKYGYDVFFGHKGYDLLDTILLASQGCENGGGYE